LTATPADTPSSLEDEIQSSCRRGDTSTAASVLVRGYGPEIMGFLAARLGDLHAAEEAFAVFSESILRSLPQFEWRASARTWSYVVARNAANKIAGERRQRQHTSLEGSAKNAVDEAATPIRTNTVPYLKTGAKDQYRELREQLSTEDRTLLILRMDRALSWRSVATILSDAGESTSEAELFREEARLRKRLELIKNQLRKLAEAQGLI
jgi:RNA polymerase sigma-70 factor, ECF subfamily